MARSMVSNGPKTEVEPRPAVVRFTRPAQPVEATQALNLSAGVSNCKVSRGRSFKGPRLCENAFEPRTLRIVFSIAFCQQHRPVRLASVTTKSRWKFYAQVERLNPVIRPILGRSNAPRVDRTLHPGALDIARRHAEFQKGLYDGP
jgi:hypothetical protein